MKIDYKICIVACVFCLIIGGLIVQSFSKPEIHAVRIGGLSFTDYLKAKDQPRFPHYIFTKGKDGRIDTFTVQKHTPINELPIQEYSRAFGIPIYVNGKPDPTHGSIYFTYQGIVDSVNIEIASKDIILKTYKKFIIFHKSLAISINIEKCIKSEFRLGITFGGKLTLFGGLSYDSDRVLNPTVGLMVEF